MPFALLSVSPLDDGGSGSATLISHDFGAACKLVVRSAVLTNQTSFTSLAGVFDGNQMNPRAATSASVKVMSQLDYIGDIAVGSKDSTISWTNGSVGLSHLVGFSADGEVAFVSSTPFDEDSASAIGGAIATQPGDLLVGTLHNSGGGDGATLDSNPPHANDYYSGRNKVFSKIAGAGLSTDFIVDFGEAVTNAVMVVSVYREAATPITATHGDQDVAYGEDPGFTGNVNGANLKAGAISIPLTLGASSTNSAPTFNLEDFTTLLRDTSWVPFAGTQLEIEITSDDGGDTPVTRNITLALPANFAQVTLAGVVNTSGSAFYQSSIYSGPDFTPEDNAQMVYDNQFNTAVAADGSLTTDRNGTEIKAWIYLPTPELLIFYPFTAPAQTVITIDGSPATLEPSTQYTATVINGTSVCDGGQTFNSGTGYDVTIDSADVNTITFTTSASLPASSPVQFKFNFPTA